MISINYSLVKPVTIEEKKKIIESDNINVIFDRVWGLRDEHSYTLGFLDDDDDNKRVFHWANYNEICGQDLVQLLFKKIKEFCNNGYYIKDDDDNYLSYEEFCNMVKQYSKK